MNNREEQLQPVFNPSPNLLQKWLDRTNLQTYINLPNVENININKPKEVWIQIAGEEKYCEYNENLSRSNLTQFAEELAIINRIDWNREKSALDAKLPTGERVHISISNSTSSGLLLSIRKRAVGKFNLHDFGFSEEQVKELERAIADKKTILISGGTSTGKTTCLEILASMIPTTTRIVEIQDPREIIFTQPDVVDLTVIETEHKKREAQLSQFASTAMRIQPQRIIIGEIRDPILAFFFMQMANTGHNGSMASIHANSPLLAIDRLANLILLHLGGGQFEIIKNQLKETINIVIQIEIDETGKRRAYFEYI